MRIKALLTIGLSLGLIILSSCTKSLSTDVGLSPAAASTPIPSPVEVDNAKNSPYGLPGDKVFTQFPTKRPATGYKLILVNPNIPAWAAYDADGNLVKTGRASAGQDYCPDLRRACKTIAGTFHVFSKGGANCKSSVFPLATHGGAPMPYCMHFYKGYALHGSYEMEDYDASHGCVRMVPSSAQWLSDNFVEVGTTVIIEPYNKQNTK